MRITNIDTCLLEIPTPRPMSLALPCHCYVVSQVHTDEGLTGLGYSMVFGGTGAEGIQAYVARTLAPMVIGEDPLFVERLWQKMTRAGRRGGIAACAVSALDIALWDIIGKAAVLPLYKLWGAASDRVPAYGSGGWGQYAVADLVAEAERYAELGCRYYKMKVHDADPRVNRQRVQEVQRALAGRARVMVDTNQRFELQASIELARALEDLDLVWYEEPVLADDLGGYAEIARAIAIPIATGENHFSRFEFRELLERHAARYLMPDVCRANGFSETIKIGHLGAAHGAYLTPHLVHELSIHVVAAAANGFLVEFADWLPDDLFEGLPPFDNGSFTMPDRPGHGLSLAAGAEKRYRTD